MKILKILKEEKLFSLQKKKIIHILLKNQNDVLGRLTRLCQIRNLISFSDNVRHRNVCRDYYSFPESIPSIMPSMCIFA